VALLTWQGRLGNCYYMAAIASCGLAGNELVHDLCIEDGADVGLYGLPHRRCRACTTDCITFAARSVLHLQHEIGETWKTKRWTAAPEHARLLDNAWSADAMPRRYGVKFYLHGKWVTVLVDDRIPTQHGRPIFAKPKEHENQVGSEVL